MGRAAVVSVTGRPNPLISPPGLQQDSAANRVRPNLRTPRANRLCPISRPRGPPLRREAPAPLADETAPQSKRRPHGRRSDDHDRPVGRRPPPPRQRAGIERSTRAAPDKRPEHARLDRNISSRRPVQRPVVGPSPRHLLHREEAQRLCPHRFRWRGTLVHASTLAPIDREPCTSAGLGASSVARRGSRVPIAAEERTTTPSPNPPCRADPATRAHADIRSHAASQPEPQR